MGRAPENHLEPSPMPSARALLIAMARDWTDPVVVRDAPRRAAEVIRQLLAALDDDPPDVADLVAMADLVSRGLVTIERDAAGTSRVWPVKAETPR